ncbi:hypothetical protein NDU88_005533 [Pleurodeles waltl]|uniref:Uncharacterized protein n=1 Tax=Pleurodeles waltl TaxID=8319 RepID=A0AAV7UJ83_PLEWA|nr:hypothetical protein NDU88_005533 [Pleurodeles waltl]
MFWSCPDYGRFWQQIAETLAELTQRTTLYTVESVVLGLFRRSKRAAAASRFVDLALIIGRRAIAMKWKSHQLPTLPHWCAAFLKWGKTEAVALRREEARGQRKIPFANKWDMCMQELEGYRE